MANAQCSKKDTNYLPDMEFANVQLNIQTVSYPVQTSSSAMASSTPISSATPWRTRISSVVVSSMSIFNLRVTPCLSLRLPRLLSRLWLL